MDLLISALAAEGIPMWVLNLAMKATGLHGAARLTTALSALGPGGMIGGLVTLLLIQAVSAFLTEAAIDRIYARVVKQLIHDGYSAREILETIDGYPVSAYLKARLKRQVTEQLIIYNA